MRSSQRTGALGLALLLAVIVVVVLVTRDDNDEPVDHRAELERPLVEVPAGDPPDELEVEDLVDGDGAEATEGDPVTVEYVGVAHSTGEEFDASWDRPDPFELTLGAGEVIAGWDEGIQGMRVGGRRQLVIPPEQAYGEQGSPPAIGPDETLIFVVDLIEVE